MLDGAAPFYDTYRCADGGWLAIGAIEPQFYAQLLDGLGLATGDDPLDPAAQFDQDTWTSTKARIAAVVATRSRDEWVDRFDSLDACVAPALAPDEAPRHPHAVARRAFVTDDRGLPEPAPAPRLSRTPPEVQPPGPQGGAALEAWGLPEVEVARLVAAGVVS
jgi:alpha-methylacyl-CoA racemase